MPAKRYPIVTFLLLSLLFCASCAKAPVDTAKDAKSTTPAPSPHKFIIAGSGCNIGITSKLAQAYKDKTGTVIEIPESLGSTGAINAVMEGSIDLGLVAKSLSPEERAAGLKEIPYAKAAAVFAAHRSVPDANLTSDEIIAILAGKKAAWSDEKNIYIFTRQDNDSTNQAMYSLIPSYEDTLQEATSAHRWQILYRNTDMINALKSTEGAFGITTLPEIAQADIKINPISLDGIAPTKENILNGSYKPILTLSFIYKDELSSRAAKFIDFVFSKEGQEILEKWYAIPLGR